MPIRLDLSLHSPYVRDSKENVDKLPRGLLGVRQDTEKPPWRSRGDAAELEEALFPLTESDSYISESGRN